MLKPSPEPRASPVGMHEELRKLIRETYPEMDERLAIMTMIERHLDHLNSLGDFERAAAFLTREEDEIRADGKRLRSAKRRRTFRVVTAPLVTIALLIAAKYVASKFGLTI